MSASAAVTMLPPCSPPQAAYYGWNISSAAASTQRVAYAVTAFRAPPKAVHVVTEALPEEDSVTGVLAPLGITFAVIFMLFAVYVAYKHSLGSKVAAKAKMEKLARDHPGIAAFSGPPPQGEGPPVVFVPVTRSTVDAHPMSRPYKLAPIDVSRSRGRSCVVPCYAYHLSPVSPRIFDVSAAAPPRWRGL